MTPKNAKAQDKAIEALIAASLRAPGKEKELTHAEISRYVDQHVTLSAEDKAALEHSKPGVMRALREILLENEQEISSARPQRAERADLSSRASRRKATGEFVEAVLIAQLTRLIATPEFPLGHFRQNKMVYFAHRKAEDNVAEFFQKQPAGPYSSRATYQGPERIAQQNGYVKKVGSGFVAGDNISKIDQYVSRYAVCVALEWVVGKFRYRRNEDLELLATVDFASLELIQQGDAITVEAVKGVIATSKNWAAKLHREIFSDMNIARALEELRELYPSTYA